MWIFYIFMWILLHSTNAHWNKPANNKNNPVHLTHKVIRDVPENCICVTLETGYFTYNSTINNGTVCGIYLMADPEYVIKITFIQFDVPCQTKNESGGLVQYLDGWELNGEIFPNRESISHIDTEKLEFCSDNKPRTFISSQNGALISYRISEVGKGFTILIEHKKHPAPCNIIHTGEPYFILKNHGIRKNCSIWAPYPAMITFNKYSIGNPQSQENDANECPGCLNRIEIGGSDGLDTNRIEVLGTICNKSKLQAEKQQVINCATSTVKLVSNDGYNNYLNISMSSFSSQVLSEKHIKYQCNAPLI